MCMISTKRITALLQQLETELSSKDAYEQLGVTIIRQAIEPELAEKSLLLWQQFYQEESIQHRPINKFNPVDFQAEAPKAITELYKTPDILDIIEQFIGANIGVYSSKLLVKDASSSGTVFLHQDHVYQHGLPGKITGFLAISESTPEMGAMQFYPGTHLFGDLGDAGEIDPTILPADWPIYQPTLAPGDMVLMNPYIWHASPSNTTDQQRVILGTTYQPASDYTSIEVLRGDIPYEPSFMNSPDRQQNFIRSRTSRLTELQAIVDKL